MSDPTRLPDDELLADLLLTWEGRRERGEEVSPADLCRDRPDLLPALTARIELLRSVTWVKKDLPPPSAADDQAGPPAEPLAGRYRLDALIGEGGFGRVWQGFDLQLMRTVAVKVPRSDRAARRAGGEDAFLAEARKVARLSHPGIVPVFDVGQHGGRTFIVSALIDGEDLGQRMKAAPVPVREAVQIVAEAARHLDYAHREGFVHRDVKPANILVGRDGRVFVSDFGIATSADSAGAVGGGSGTPAYMAPERFSLSSAADVRGDVYALGVVLYELLTGRLPFSAGSPDGLWAAILGYEPPSPRSVNPAVPEMVERVCLRCLSKDVAGRPATAAVVADNLAAWLASEGQEQGGRLLGRIRTWLGRSSRATPASTPAETIVGGTTSETWAGKEVVLKHLPAYLCSPGNDGQDVVSGWLNNQTHEVFADTGDWIKIGLTTVNVRVHKNDVVLKGDAINYFSRCIRQDPNNLDHYLRRAIGFHALGRHEESMADCNAALQITPNSARCLVERGWAWGLTGDKSKVLDDMTEAIRLQSQAAWTWEARACVWGQIGEHGKAEDDLTKAIALDPMCANLLVKRGNARWNMGKAEHAIKDCEVAIQIDPSSAYAHYYLGASLYWRWQYQSAIDHLSESIRLHPGWSATWARRADAYKEANQPESAAADYTEAIRLDPKDVDSVLKRAILWAMSPASSPRGETVEDTLSTCENGKWKESAAIVSLAVAYAERKLYSKAANCLRKALAMTEFAARHDKNTKKLIATYDQLTMQNLRQQLRA